MSNTHKPPKRIKALLRKKRPTIGDAATVFTWANLRTPSCADTYFPMVKVKNGV
jgi:hypothetical protein